MAIFQSVPFEILIKNLDESQSADSSRTSPSIIPSRSFICRVCHCFGICTFLQTSFEGMEDMAGIPSMSMCSGVRLHIEL